MKIASSHIDFASQHQASSQHTVQESLRAWRGQTRPDFEDNQASRAATTESNANRSTQVSLSAAALQRFQESAAASNAPPQLDSNANSAEMQAIQEASEQIDKDPRMHLIRQLVEMLSGSKIKTLSASTFHSQTNTQSLEQVSRAQSPETARAGFGIEYERHAVYTETEQTHFQASGVVLTSDGQQIEFQLELNMQRHFRIESNTQLVAGDGRKKDPLVINFNGAAAELQNQRFLFDLDADGSQENIALLGPHSGFLAFDRNQDQKINDGSELFGTASGNGFADLRQYDADQNGWIDENDAIYSQLKVWTPNPKGAGHLASLQEKQVGALYLGQHSTPFELRDSQNQSLGSVRSSGLYLNENGTSGSLQQVDLSI